MILFLSFFANEGEIFRIVFGICNGQNVKDDMEDDNPCKQMVDHWEPKERNKKTSFLKAATQLATQNRFPEER